MKECRESGKRQSLEEFLGNMVGNVQREKIPNTLCWIIWLMKEEKEVKISKVTKLLHKLVGAMPSGLLHGSAAA